MPMPEIHRKIDDHSHPLDRGYVHVYTGNGKGKTTAALGLALRAAGSGLQVAIATFMKNGTGGEFGMLEQLKARIQVHDYGSGCFIHGRPAGRETILAQRGCRSIEWLMKSRQFDLMILDEANMAVACGLLNVETLLDLIRSKPAELELVITGRCAHPDVIAAADLVTEMKEVKHYYRKGIQARPGIDL
ncbi:cob(I)yrinic acid a,c-diamide adenosyltransferase [uncultured Desulfosarcina sp.]|uniref:cob(I)yrinic acid a,c-diamide adenosyltransferase n=1 Tax=uncultured Desulfosarcina sp. TaxID=218289 RepID=UPI0029C6B6EC|nr:cob(I)yrinic acid a,c-diamide adenosyltransferase [uncultured Desulfosarcina sp.]